MTRGRAEGLAVVAAVGALAFTLHARANLPQGATSSEEELTEVVVQAHEPRYVAPTRRDRIGRVWVPVYINDKGPFRLVLDSGATNSAVIPRVASELGLSTADAPQVLMRGVTGAAVTPTIRVQSLAVGDLEVGKSLLPLVPDAFGGAEGLLGTEGMSDKRIYIDFLHDFVNISRSKNRRAEVGFHALPLIPGAGKLLVVRATIGSVRARAIIDTGAQASVGNLPLLEALERHRREKGSADLITGATGATQVGEGFPIHNISLGDVMIQNAHITFGDMHIFSHWDASEEPTILIGMDILGLVDTLVIDYHRQELHIKPREGRQTPFDLSTRVPWRG